MKKIKSFVCAGLVCGVFLFLGIPISAAVELVYWTHSGEVPHYNEMIGLKGKEFARLHPEFKGVRVEMVPYAGYMAKYMAAFKGVRGAPDIFLGMAHQWAGVYKYAAPMPKEFAEKVDKEVLPLLKDMGVMDGVRYGIPLKDALLLLFVNTQMCKDAGLAIDNPPKNFDEFLEWAKALTVYGPSGEITRAGFGMRYSGSAQGIIDKAMPFFAGMGARLICADFSTATGYMDSPEAEETLAYLTNCISKWKVSSLKVGKPTAAFAKDLAAMIFRPGWYAGYLEENAPKVKYRVFPPPQNENNIGYHSYTLFPWSNLVYKYSPQKDWAWKFLEFIWNKEDDLEMHKGMMPVMEKSLYTSYARSRPEYDAFMTVMNSKYYAPAYYHPAMNMIFTELGNAMVEAYYGRVSPDTALGLVTTRVNQMLRKR